MRTSRREAAIPLALSVGAVVLAFAQRPGLATTDTKINLQVDPGRFLADVASMWTSSGQLGDVQAGQYSGYLFPMGPFFAAGHALGLGAWVVQRLWLAAVLALVAWGTVRLLDALLDRSRGPAHLMAGTITILNPFVVTYVNRTTVTLLAYVALPWLLLIVHRALHDDRPGARWRWPVVFALVVAAAGGGINAAVVAWMLLGPALLLLYEWRVVMVTGARVGGFMLRMAPLTILVSLWWLIPVYVQTSYGVDFLHFTEQPGTVWGTTSVTESLRLMSYWLSYVGIGFAGHAIAYFDDSSTLLFSVPVLLATLLLPAAALGGFAWTRRWRYGPFFLAMALLGVLIMFAGFPDGTGLRHGLYFIYNRVSAVRFLRASDKAAPLLAIALACLSGAAFGEGWRRLAGVARPRQWRLVISGACAVVLALAAWPLVTGRAQDSQVSFQRVPAAWRQAAAGLDRTLPSNARAMVLPGDLFSFYRWGGTVDPILPVLSRRPVAERTEVPYADLRATDLMWTIDSLVHQQRLLPGQLSPLLGLIGVRQVVTGTDDDLARSDAPPPADVATELAAQPGFAHAARAYGPVSSFAPTGPGVPLRLPQVRRYDLPAARGLIRIEPRGAPTVVDGSAAGIASLAAFGALPVQGSLLYSGDLSPAALRTALAAGGTLAITDSNRRQAFVVGSLEQNSGPTLTAAQALSADGYDFDPFARGPDFETVAQYTGVSLVQAPSSPETRQFPEHAPFAAIDGSAQTSWLADPTLDPSQRWLQVDFEHPRAVPYVDLLPAAGAGTVEQVQLAGRSFALHPGWNRLRLGVSGVAALRVTLTRVAPAPRGASGAGGISELRIPGVQAHERLRLPVDAARALSGHDLTAVRLLYLFSRNTGDYPYARALAVGGASLSVRSPGDAEQTMTRSFTLPVARRLVATGWVTAFAQTADDELDRLAGYRGPIRATSSSRFDGEPRWRASRALDGDPATAWIGDYGAAPAWLQWRLPRPIAVARMRLTAPTQAVRRPTRIRVLWPGGQTPPLTVGAGGAITLPRRVTAHAFRIEILGAAAPIGASAAQRRAVGIAEIQGIPSLGRVRETRSGRAFRAPCGSVALRVGRRMPAMRVAGTRTAFENGAPLRASGCGSPIGLSAGAHQLTVAPGPFALDALALSSAASAPASAAPSGGAVLASGTAERGSYDHVRVTVSHPAWLVLGEGYNRGWQAWCDGRSLGTPVPIDGYANGWPVRPGCRSVHLAFGPNHLALIGYVASGIAVLGCLVALLAVWWRRRRVPGGPVPAPPAAVLPAPAAGPKSADRQRIGRSLSPRGLLIAVGAAIAFGFVFGVVAGLVALAAILVVLWRGIGAATLAVAAGLLLGAVVPVLYLIEPGDQHAGNHYGYASQHLNAHWVGVAAVGLLMGALWRTLRGADGASR